MPVVSRQSYQSQLTLLKPLLLSSAGLDSGGPDPPALQVETESPVSRAQKWVAGTGGSWWGREGRLLG